MENKNRSHVQTIVGTGIGDNKNGSGQESGRSGNNGGKSGPKIHGVRVTVDTGDARRSKENTESVEITDVGKHMKRVGIHTDITFEISTDGDNVGNTTSSVQKEDREDTSVPIYKGRTEKTHKSHDPSERRSFEFPTYHYPQYYSNNVPGYLAAGDGPDMRRGTFYRLDDSWGSYVLTSNSWTTERTYNEKYHPNTVTGHRRTSWKPCYCMTAFVGYRKHRKSHHVPSKRPAQPTGSIIQQVDGKLENLFLNR